MFLPEITSKIGEMPMVCLEEQIMFHRNPQKINIEISNEVNIRSEIIAAILEC